MKLWTPMLIAALALTASVPAGAEMDIHNTLSDEAQRNTIAFSGLAFATGSLGAYSFFPPGKVADFVVLSGDPLSVYTQVLETWVEGEKLFDRGRDEDLLAAVGGWGAGSPRTTHVECFDHEEAGR